MQLGAKQGWWRADARPDGLMNLEQILALTMTRRDPVRDTSIMLEKNKFACIKLVVRERSVRQGKIALVLRFGR